MTLSGDQFLPGMGSLRPALPHEQTQSQFHNRPDVFVHGRYERTMPGSTELDMHDGNTVGRQGFHAGTETAAHERLGGLGVPWQDHSPRFYHGRVASGLMKNTAVPGKWETGYSDFHDKGRVADQGEDWDHEDHGKYYRNDYEDKGSTSVILPMNKTVDSSRGYEQESYRPQNFQTHREAVSDALRKGAPVPRHVQDVFEATGGSQGPRSVTHSQFETPQPQRSSRYSKYDDSLPSIGHPVSINKFVPNAQHSKPVPHDDWDAHDWGGYGSPPF